MREPKPFYRKQTRSFYVQLDAQQINLGPDEKGAWHQWHLLMAERLGPSNAITVKELVKKFCGWLEQATLAPRTKVWYKAHLKSFESVAGAKTAEKITQDDIDDWFAECGDGWGDNYRLGSFRALSRMYNWARKRGHVTQNPITYMERPAYQPRDVYLTDEQWNTIIKGARADLADILTFIKHTGCRPHEARTAESKHFDGKCIVFERKNSKGKKQRRVIILDNVALAIVRRRIDAQGNGPMFLKRNGSPWMSFNLSGGCQRIADKTGIPFTPYTLRHTAASNLLVASNNDVAVATILGHTDVNMLKKVYGHLDKHPEHLKRLRDDANGVA